MRFTQFHTDDAFYIHIQVKCLGGLWLERNLFVFVHHILELVANPKATPTHVDAVYSRKCVIFIMHATVGRMLGEKAQVTGRKICLIWSL